MLNNRQWTHEAIKKIEADIQRSADTHLIKLLLIRALCSARMIELVLVG